MVSVRLKGGLGNQLSQAAFAYALADAGNEVQFDLSALESDPTRAYALDHWNIDIPIGTASGSTQYEFQRETVNEGDLYYKPEFLKKYDHDITLDGYWQSYKYWNSAVQRKIRQAFTLKYYPSDKTLELARKIHESNSVFLHVRRSDNLSARGLAFHGLGSEAYWAQAIFEIQQRVEDPEFFVFSDDIEWCKEQPRFAGATFVDHNSTGVTVDSEYALRKTDNGTEHEDLILMKLCKHGIMATSSFSGWAAWLGPHQTGGVVVRPEQWFIGEYNKMSRDMHPTEWIAI